MRRRSVRVLVLLLTVAVTAAAVWRATTTERTRGRARLAEQRVDAAAAEAIYTLTDLRGTLHAYVAPGQGIAFWSARASEQLGRIRALLDNLDEAATAAGHPLTTARETLDRVAASERRARSFVGDGQLLVAGDVIYTEAGELIDTVSSEFSAARQSLARAASAREAGTANAQSLLAGGVLSIWIVALMLLVPLPRETTRSPVPEPETVAGTGPLALSGPQRLGPEDPPSETPTSRSGVRVASPALDLESLARLCADLGSVTRASELDPLLGRAAALLDARGLMVWLAEPGGDTLAAAAAHGYEPDLLARVGRIGRDADNLTASVFRSGSPAMTEASATRPAAIAVPLPSLGGPGGVLALELAAGINHDLRQITSLAGILAAQLANLFPAPEEPADLSRQTPAQA